MSCALAALTIAAITGAMAGVAICCFGALTARTPLVIDEIGPTIGFTVYAATLAGSAIGTPVAAFVVCISRASFAPWRSLPLLAVGATLGFVLVGMPWSLLPGTEELPYLAVPLVGAVAGGAFATRFVRRTYENVSSWPVVALAGFVLGQFVSAITLAHLISGLLARYDNALTNVALPQCVLILLFAIDLTAASAVVCVLVRRLAWDSVPFGKGAVIGLIGGIFIVPGFEIFVIPAA